MNTQILTARWMVPVCILLTAVADYLFWGHVVGWTAGLFLLLLAASCLLADWRAVTERAGQLLLGYVVLASAALMIEPGGCAFWGGLCALLMFRMTAAYGWERNPLFWGVRVVWFGIMAWAQWAFDLGRCRRFGGRGFAGGRLVLRWALPLGLTLVFIVLFALSNPVFANRVSSVFRYVFDMLAQISIPNPFRIIFWGILAVLIWALLRMATGHRFFVRNTDDIAVEESWLARFSLLRAEAAGAMAVRCLILFNIVFLIQNIMDIEYLWAGVKLPGDMTYATYAHRGAYPLIATALLAGAMVLVCFAGNGESKVWRLARRLVYIWLAQNVFLVFSAMLRLGKYVDVYSLTLLRVAALVWMLAVAVGLVLIAVRILCGKRNLWLVNANLASLAVIMLVCGFCDFRGWVADYNVSHCREAAPSEQGVLRAPLDLGYLRELGNNALPSLVWLEREHGAAFNPYAREEITRQIKSLRGATAFRDWQSWTWRGHQLRQLQQ